MQTGAPPIPWLRLIAEAGVVVLSILLALAVDEWREGRRDRGFEHEYLQRLLNDADTNLSVITIIRDAQTSQVSNARLVYPLVSQGDWQDLDTATVVLASYLATPSPTPTWVDDTFEELKSTGRLALIRSATIRAELLAYYRYLEERDYTYELMSTGYRDAVRARMDPDLQLRIRAACRPEPDCRVDVSSPGLDDYIRWLTSNRDLADGLRRVIVQWTRGNTEYLPRAEEQTLRLKALIEVELRN